MFGIWNLEFVPGSSRKEAGFLTTVCWGRYGTSVCLGLRYSQNLGFVLETPCREKLVQKDESCVRLCNGDELMHVTTEWKVGIHGFLYPHLSDLDYTLRLCYFHFLLFSIYDFIHLYNLCLKKGNFVPQIFCFICWVDRIMIVHHCHQFG
jgi:hypothetical protein